MAVLAGQGDERVRAHFAAQAAACEALGSAFTASLCRAAIRVLDASTETGRKILGWTGDPDADALALRLCGALHALVLSGSAKVLAASFPPRSAAPIILEGLLPGILREFDARIASALASPPQTNEVGRAAMLLPGFLLLAREFGLPLALHEIGASAGLNGLFDRFGYRFGADTWGDAESPVLLAPRIEGAPVLLEGDLRIAAREASDKTPVRIKEPAERLRLRAFVWPDQPERLKRLDAALDLASAVRLKTPRQREADEAVRGWLAARQPAATAVLFHSVVWQYLPPDMKRATVAAMAGAGAAATIEAPLAWLRLEPAGAGATFPSLSLTVWPGGATRHLADCDFHGRWIAWRRTA